MKITKLLLFAILLLITPSLYGQNIGSGGYTPTELFQEIKEVLNNVRENKEKLDNKQGIKAEQNIDISNFVVSSLLSYAVEKDEYNTAKTILEYAYKNSYNQVSLSRAKARALKNVIQKHRYYISHNINTIYFKCDEKVIDKWAALLIDNYTDLSSIYNAIDEGKYIVINAQEVIKILKKYK